MTPISVDYKSIKIGTKSIELSGSGRVSFTAPYNAVNVVMRPNLSLTYYEVRVTKADAEYGIGVGNRAYWETNIPADKDTTFAININSTYFDKGDGIYRIGLYAQSVQGGQSYWDVTYLFITSSGDTFIPSGSSGLEAIAHDETPTEI